MRRTSSLSPCATRSRTTTTESRPIATRRLRSPWPEVGGRCAGGGRRETAAVAACVSHCSHGRPPFCTRHGSGMASRCRAGSIIDERLARFEHERLQRLGPIEQPRHVADGLGDQRFACGARNRSDTPLRTPELLGHFRGTGPRTSDTTEQVADPGCQGPQTDDSAILASMGSIGGAGGGQKACVGGVKLRIGRSQIGPALNPSRIDPRPSLRQILRELPLQSLGIARHRTIDPARHVADALWLFIRCSEPVA